MRIYIRFLFQKEAAHRMRPGDLVLQLLFDVSIKPAARVGCCHQALQQGIGCEERSQPELSFLYFFFIGFSCAQLG